MLGKIWYGFCCVFVVLMFIGGLGKCTGFIKDYPNYDYDISQYDSVPDNELYDLDLEAWKERQTRFDYEYGKKINNLSLKGRIDRQTDKYWRRLVGETVYNHKTFEVEPKAPFYEPQNSLGCKDMGTKEFFNVWLMRRDLEDKYQGDERAIDKINQMSCISLYKNTFGVTP